MDFRAEKCAWCPLKSEPAEKCRACPKYIKITKKKKVQLLAGDFCSICGNNGNEELKIYCERNRYFQREPAPGEDFDCYKYIPGGMFQA